MMCKINNCIVKLEMLLMGRIVLKIVWEVVEIFNNVIRM